MKRRLLLTAFVLAAGLAAAQHVPIFPQGEIDAQSRLQLVANLGAMDLLAEGLGQYSFLESALGYRSLTVGAYFRALPNLKLGAFYRVQAAARHNDDVTAILVGSPDWQWADTSGRLESVLMLDASPRFLLPFLPGENWVLMTKTRLIYNASYQNETSLLIRPELTYFWIVDRVPLLNASLSYDRYFALNFGEAPLYQSYPYLTLLWHATPELGIELGGGYKATTWSTSASWADAAWSSYAIPVRSWVASLGIVYTPSF
jgi:hypothetical protein